MAYQSLYRRYRPQKFAEVRGQDHLVTALQNAVREDRVGHAYLFSGPRGTGKTSTARILAKVLNCEKPQDGEPCGACESCVAIEAGTSFDVHELDAASNNKVEDVRDLIARIALGTPGRTKVYILDEVHMLSTAASNALLKTLEEPPDHVVFVLATTDPQKVLPTIRSRTQHFEVHLLSAEELRALADYIVADAGLDLPPEAIDYAVRAGAGSARDMESALDQVAAAGGIPDGGEALDEVVEALCERDTGRALLAVETAVASGRSPRTFGEAVLGRLRDVFLATMQVEPTRLPDHERDRVRDQARRLGAAGATRSLETVGEAFVGIQDAPDPRVPLEVALVRLTRPQLDPAPSALLERIERLERAAGAGPRPDRQDRPGPAAGAEPSPPDPDASGTTDRPEAGDPTDPTGPTDADGSADERSDGGGEGNVTTIRPADEAGRPADEARQRLARRRSGATAQASEPRSRTRAGAGEGESRTGEGGSTTADGSTPRRRRAAKPTGRTDRGGGDGGDGSPAPAPSRGSAPGDAAGGPLPSRDELTLAWGDHVLGSLPQKAKARFGAGRWLAVDDGRAVFALPNEIHRQRCEDVRGEVEAALAAHFGRAVPVVLAVDDGTAPGPAPGGAGGTGPSAGAAHDAAAESDPDDGLTSVDIADLADADASGHGDVDRITDLFPGAELVEDD